MSSFVLNVSSSSCVNVMCSPMTDLQGVNFLLESFSSQPNYFYFVAILLYIVLIVALVFWSRKLGERLASYCRVAAVLSFVFLLYGSYLVMLLWDVSFLNLFDKAREGVFGDSFGTLNTLFSGLAFSGVLITLMFQRKDLSETRKQIASQQVESQFYNMLSQQQEVVRGLDLQSREDNEVIARGRDCFREWHENLQSMYKDIGKNQKLRDPYALSYGCLFEVHKSDLGLYYRSLYSVFRYIERCGHDDAKEFGRILRSLLSDYELVLIFYNCLTERGENFKRFVYQHGLFDNIDPTLLLSKHHVRIFDAEAYGSNKKMVDQLKESAGADPEA